jgi:hypothetical protein
MYHDAFLYGFAAQLMFPPPLPTLYGANGPQVYTSRYRFANGFVRSIPLNPGHA